MSWIKKHNSKIFRKQVRETLKRRLSDGDYECVVHEKEDGWWYGKQMFSVKIEFRFCRASLIVHLRPKSAYWDYENETVDSACEKIIDELKMFCEKFDVDGPIKNRERYSVHFLSTYVLEKIGGQSAITK